MDKYLISLKHRIVILLFCISLAGFGQNNESKLANEYFQSGDFEKAKLLYENLEDDKVAIPLIHANYLQLLFQEADFKNAEKYLQKVLKYYPSNLQYHVDLIRLFHLQGDLTKKKKYLEEIQAAYKDNHYQLSTVAQYLASAQFYEESISFYVLARKLNGRNSSFAMDLAAIYRLQNNKPAMTEEYINYAEGNPANISYIKNLFQNILNEEEDREYLETTLIRKIQEYPNETLYPDLLIWLELQRENFYGAFIQARALDKRNGKPGNESMQIAYIAYDNQSWQDAIDIFQYVIDEYGDSPNYPSARRMLIRSKENLVKSKYPVNLEEIRTLISDYSQLYKELGPNPVSLEALKNKALLHAFYLNELDTAISILNFIISNGRSPRPLVSETKLDLGDIYLLIGQPWESTLLYSQVEKSDKESPTGYEAKLRNARLNYFTGNFSLAKSHLDILKIATTREISNDAIALSLLISDNTAFDTTDYVMQQFANVELLIFQNQKDKALEQLDNLLTENPGHSLTDEAYWLQAKLFLEMGGFEKAVERLDKIIVGYSYDILSDDAFFRKATITENHLDQKDEALRLYTEFLKKHPGSIYAARARLRIRDLRGDLVN